jgi:hypothetical protein
MIGFLTVVEHCEWGMTGGLLILNAAGRPLEFHCTAPIKPNRAQEILYGPTLRPFLYGEQIGQTLLGKVKNETLFVCTDVEPALCARDGVSLAMVLLLPTDSERLPADYDARQRTLRFDAPHDAPGSGTIKLTRFTLGNQAAACPAHHAADRDLIIQRWQPYAEQLDLREPFERIREALAEAQRGVAA